MTSATAKWSGLELHRPGSPTTVASPVGVTITIKPVLTVRTSAALRWFALLMQFVHLDLTLIVFSDRSGFSLAKVLERSAN